MSAAESALRKSEACTPAEASLHVARAQVHATLALAAATAAARPRSVSPVPGNEKASTWLPDAPETATPTDLRAAIRQLVELDTSAFKDDLEDDQKKS